MRSEAEIRKALDEIESDERLHYRIASGYSNWPLLAIQCDLKGRANAYRFALGLPLRHYFGEDEATE